VRGGVVAAGKIGMGTAGPALIKQKGMIPLRVKE